MKATGAEIKQFWDEWPPGEHWYHDDSVIEVYGLDRHENEKFLLESDQKYDLADFGFLIWQGLADMKIPKYAPMNGCQDVSFEKWFKHWKKTKTSTSFGVTVNNDQIDEFREIAKKNSWKVS